MKGARGDEEDMVGLHRPIFGRDRCALDQRQQVALHALTAHRAAAHVADRDLVDLVEEDDPARLGIGKRDARDIVLIQALVLLLLDEARRGFENRQLAALSGAPAHGFAKHVRQIYHAHLSRLAGQFEVHRSEEHTSELQSLMRISYAVFCLKKKKYKYNYN